MRWIKYQIVQSTVGEEDVLVNKKIGYSEANIAIAEVEAYNGQYEIVEDEKSYDDKPLAVEFGGTGKTKGVDALKAFLEDGYLVLSPKQFGTEFPEDAPDGTIFFKEVVE